MQASPRNAESVKQQIVRSDYRTQLLHYLEDQIEAAYALAAVREVFAAWVRHGLVSPEHIALLMTAEAGGVQ
jgi:hypothetical protein